MTATISVPRDLVVGLLVQWKYLPEGREYTDAEVEAAILQYQKMHALPETGLLDQKTVHQLTNPYRCGLPDRMDAQEQVCAWPMKNVKVFPRLSQSSPLPAGLTAASIIQAFSDACESWNAVCGIRLQLIQTTDGCNILSDFGTGSSDNLDGPGGTLAWSYLPCGARSNTTLQQKYDWRERWTQTMLQAVAAHEIGHAIGLNHLSAGALLAPYYNPQIIKPQAADIAEVVKRYGSPSPTSPPVPPAGGSPIVKVLQIQIGDAVYEAAGPMRKVS